MIRDPFEIVFDWRSAYSSDFFKIIVDDWNEVHSWIFLGLNISYFKNTKEDDKKNVSVYF